MISVNVLVVGLSHRSAPVEVLERAAVATDEVPKLLDEMLQGSHVTEVMMLSTCNRVEVYAVVDAFKAAYGAKFCKAVAKITDDVDELIGETTSPLSWRPAGQGSLPSAARTRCRPTGTSSPCASPRRPHRRSHARSRRRHEVVGSDASTGRITGQCHVG
jgi:hypothetical protein